MSNRKPVRDSPGPGVPGDTTPNEASESALKAERRLQVEDLARLAPGAGEVMAQVSRSFALAWHAAEHANWDLAAFNLRRTRSALRRLAVTRPKLAADLSGYETSFLGPVIEAALARDQAAFRSCFEAAVAEANRLHVATGYGYIVWEIPADSPDPALDLEPRPKAN